MEDWIDVGEQVPEEAVTVCIRLRGQVRTGYYRIRDRWYWIGDLDRWQMNTSPYWAEDRAWYLNTEEIEGWRAETEPAGPAP
ncbi:hypothetical protein GQ464_015240 [Rhodocaloribacter litoris]|uniref:hypothetical protein n=1 Tax=Rhodocaloribacter litoris TaxID=2558931 RepID=UPI001421EA4D|nr:hypothetical protein [Rhodocaloribacter litoris]QXD14762.1 hypothetical protein GQ464_015240 [Rhodocaloribacter litoris]GIV59152.1 MAG: hypothetical protein KatS3mg043_0241 [Rhodothermaceae bacterium]